MTEAGPAARRPAVVANPSKTDDVRALREAATAALVGAGLPEPQWYETTAEDPGLGQTREALAAGCDLVIAHGGDGTVRACAQALLGTGVALAMLPNGTGNLLARNLGVPDGIEEAAVVAATGPRVTIDVAAMDGEPFVVMGGSGFDARMFAATSESLKGRVGWLAYAVAGVRALRSSLPRDLHLQLDDRHVRMRSAGLVVGNVGTLTAGLVLLPEARPDDGILDVAVLTPARLWDWAGMSLRLLTRREPLPRQLVRFQATTVTATWRDVVPAEIDGDLVDARARLRFTVVPGALTVCVPAEPEGRQS